MQPVLKSFHHTLISPHSSISPQSVLNQSSISPQSVLNQSSISPQYRQSLFNSIVPSTVLNWPESKRKVEENSSWGDEEEAVKEFDGEKDGSEAIQERQRNHRKGVGGAPCHRSIAHMDERECSFSPAVSAAVELAVCVCVCVKKDLMKRTAAQDRHSKSQCTPCPTCLARMEVVAT
jgi:hypothetical protein